MGESLWTWLKGLSNGDDIALGGAIAALLALLVALWQLNRANKIARGQSWLTLRDLMSNYDDIIANLRPRGDWHKSWHSPHTLGDWARVETYMGLFEYCGHLIETGLLDKKQFAASYGFRIRNLLTNPRIVKFKLHENADGWKEFTALCRTLKIAIPGATVQPLPFIYSDALPSKLPPRVMTGPELVGLGLIGFMLMENLRHPRRKKLSTRAS